MTTTNETGLRTKDDETISILRARVIVTRDQDFLRIANRTADHSGVVFYTASQSLRQIIEGLILIYEVMMTDEIVGYSDSGHPR